MKTCYRCKIEKPKDEFPKDKGSKDGLKSLCKSCWSAYVREYKDTPNGKEVQRKRDVKYRNTPKGQAVKRNIRLKGRYGITLKDYDIMLKNQDYVCAICGTNEPGTQGRLCVDHCHNTEKVRGLLCSNCNIMLGCAKDSINVLLKAAQYLAKYLKET